MTRARDRLISKVEPRRKKDVEDRHRKELGLERWRVSDKEKYTNKFAWSKQVAAI
jgi:hypothetical protein